MTPPSIVRHFQTQIAIIGFITGALAVVLAIQLLVWGLPTDSLSLRFGLEALSGAPAYAPVVMIFGLLGGLVVARLTEVRGGAMARMGVSGASLTLVMLLATSVGSIIPRADDARTAMSILRDRKAVIEVSRMRSAAVRLTSGEHDSTLVLMGRPVAVPLLQTEVVLSLEDASDLSRLLATENPALGARLGLASR